MVSESLRTVVVCDLDGVVWRGNQAIRGGARAVNELRLAGLRVVFLTNNSSLTSEAIVEKLGSVGVRATAPDVLSSATATAHLLARDTPRGARILACAGPGVVEALEAVGFDAVQAPPADAVVVGWHRDFDFDGLDRAATAVRDGARFVATNIDATFPVPGRLLPGNGALVAAVATASGRRPEVAGKPEPPTVALVRDLFGTHGVVIGDRPSTDGALANALGWPFALVLSGVASRDPRGGAEAVPDPPPRYVADDLASVVPALVADFSRSAPDPA